MAKLRIGGVKLAQAQARPAVKNSASSAKRVLVAEDNEVTHELLDLLLSQRGHEVDIVTDGRQALSAIEQKLYDVVLMDFHLPGMDGLEVAASYKSSRTRKATPRFIAITADMKGLLGHAANCENFDEIVAKPFDLEDICKLVEAEPDGTPKKKPAKPTRKPAKKSSRKPAARCKQKNVTALADGKPAPDRASWVDGLGLELLNWPGDLDHNRLSARARHASLGDGSFDAIVIRDDIAANHYQTVWQTKSLQALPIIDLAGRLGRRADLDASAPGSAPEKAVKDLTKRFAARRARLHRDFLLSEDLGERLLSRIFMAGGDLVAAYDPADRHLVSYNVLLDGDAVGREAEKLVSDGLLSKRFFDRFHVCVSCEGSRFNVREECADCRSADLSEQSYLHHFKCAYQGPESDFRVDDDLICPKCRMELSHFSIDYDKPGTMLQCATCDHASSEPAVGLICLDCGVRSDGDTVTTRDRYSYALTERAIALLETGRALLGEGRNPLQFAELPLQLIVAINRELAAYKDKQQPFCLLDISYRNARQIEVEHGARQFDQARDLVLENLDNALAKEDVVVKGHAYDYALLKGVGADEARKTLDELRGEAMNAVQFDLDVGFAVYGPELFA